MFNKQEAWGKYPMGDVSDSSKINNTTNFINDADYDTSSTL